MFNHMVGPRFAYTDDYELLEGNTLQFEVGLLRIPHVILATNF